jgi:threonine dehydrogenase-like Zn-dependent dehydrogenase
MLDYHGRLNLFGGLPEGVKTIALPSNIVHYRHVTITGTTGASTYQYHEALDLVVARRVDVASLVSAVFPLARIHEALDLARSGEAAKVLIHP